jgi:hypothetical protein
MKLRDYLHLLNEIAKQNPHLLDVEVVHSSDDEGNQFHPVVYGPSLGHYDTDGHFMTEDEKVEIINAICIN